MILMRKNSSAEYQEVLSKAAYLVGDAGQIVQMSGLPSKAPFDREVVSFLSELSKELMNDRKAKEYPDVVTFAFWIRSASVAQMEKKYGFHDGLLHLGSGLVFHIAPSNVPVNFAYSLAAGLMTGNANVVRIPSKDFPQIEIIIRAVNRILLQYQALQPYIALIRYGREREINDVLSAMADVRVIWGGDATIEELRKSPLPPRGSEVAFADRFSFSVIDSACYLQLKDKKKTALDFYHDTYLSDQNACTSPRLVVWTGDRREEAKEIFWGSLYDLVRERYHFQTIMAVNKLTSACLLAAQMEGTKMAPAEDNLLVRVSIPEITDDIIRFRDHSGYFLEYDCADLMELRTLCADKRVQTIGLIGDPDMFKPLLLSGVKGIDRIVPIGKTMDFDLLWDGYRLTERLTRTICL